MKPLEAFPMCLTKSSIEKDPPPFLAKFLIDLVAFIKILNCRLQLLLHARTSQ